MAGNSGGAGVVDVTVDVIWRTTDRLLDGLLAMLPLLAAALVVFTLLLLRHPFRVGDEMTTVEFTGTVEAIETRATHIRTYDGRRVIIPNGDAPPEPRPPGRVELVRSGEGSGGDDGRA